MGCGASLGYGGNCHGREGGEVLHEKIMGRGPNAGIFGVFGKIRPSAHSRVVCLVVSKDSHSRMVTMFGRTITHAGAVSACLGPGAGVVPLLGCENTDTRACVRALPLPTAQPMHPCMCVCVCARARQLPVVLLRGVMFTTRGARLRQFLFIGCGSP